MEEFEACVNKIFYCGFSVVVDMGNGEYKIIYISKYPPINSLSPDFTKMSPVEDCYPDTISKEGYINFIRSDEPRQVNGNWKGGIWGDNNFTITGTYWFPGLFIGDTIIIRKIRDGIIPYQNDFNTIDIITNSDNEAWSCLSSWNNFDYQCYATDESVSQYANDVFFCRLSDNSDNPNKYIKMLKRGEGINIDFQHKITCCSGEHIQKDDIDYRESIIRTVKEELGLPDNTILKCYLLKLVDDDRLGRDPRYVKYSTMDNGSEVEFGIDRNSLSNVYALVIQSDIEPEEDIQSDTEEINNKWWEDINDVLKRVPEEEFMLETHFEYLQLFNDALDKFIKLPDHEKENLLFV